MHVFAILTAVQTAACLLWTLPIPDAIWPARLETTVLKISQLCCLFEAMCGLVYAHVCVDHGTTEPFGKWDGRF